METKIFGHVRPPRVLLVEDNTLIALDLEEILKGYGCRVVGPSMTVREALEVLDREEVDIAVVDYLSRTAKRRRSRVGTRPSRASHLRSAPGAGS